MSKKWKEQIKQILIFLGMLCCMALIAVFFIPEKVEKAEGVREEQDQQTIVFIQNVIGEALQDEAIQDEVIRSLSRNQERKFRIGSNRGVTLSVVETALPQMYQILKQKGVGDLTFVSQSTQTQVSDLYFIVDRNFEYKVVLLTRQGDVVLQ